MRCLCGTCCNLAYSLPQIFDMQKILAVLGCCGLIVLLNACSGAQSAGPAVRPMSWLEAHEQIQKMDQRSRRYLYSYQTVGEAAYLQQSAQINARAIGAALDLQNQHNSNRKAAYSTLRLRMDMCAFRKTLEQIAENSDQQLPLFNRFQCEFQF